MARIKAQSPSQSPTREVVEPESFDLFTPDTLEEVDPESTPTKKRKRSSVTSGTLASPEKSGKVASRKNENQSKSNSKRQPQPRKPQPRAKKSTLVLGIDFGTTHSGISYVHSGNVKNGPKPLTRWDKTNTDFVKIPSAIKFDDPNVIWGVNAKQDPDAVRWFKLLLANPSDLDEETRTSVYLQEARDDLQALDKSPVEVVSIFLKHMFGQAMEMLKPDAGEAVVNNSCLHVVVTVPAIWPEHARRSMQEAVERAGIFEERDIGETTHEFVSEPEAAALATLSDRSGLPNLQAGDIIVVVDCGGGTVDIITYKIVKPHPMAVHEAVPGRGALCGGLFVAERFKKLVIKKLEEVSEDAMSHVSEQEMQEIMDRHWEGEIRNQIGGEAHTWTIRLPFNMINVDRLDLSRGYPTITITSAEVKEVFRPSVEKIEFLINSQIEAATKKGNDFPKHVILAGGLGSSGYLYEYLKRRFPDLEVLQGSGTDPWSAISRGSVLHGMNKLKISTPIKVVVKARVSRESYGVVGKESWNDEKHHPADKWFDPILQKHVSIMVMEWHVKQGDEVPNNHKLSIHLTKFLDKLPEKIIVVIYKSLTDQPSQRMNESVVKATQITWENIQVDWDRLKSVRNKQGKIFKKLEYRVEMHCGAGAATFSIYHRGHKEAAKNISLKYF